MKVALIVNPVAGQGRSKKVLSRIKPKLKSAGFKLKVYLTEQVGQATQFANQAKREGIETVIAVGGDGTVSEVVNGIAEEKIRLGLIPSGTADVFAREMGIPTHRPLAAGDIITQGKTRKIDLGKAGSRYFILMAGIGFDAQVVHEVKSEVKRLLKDIAYPLTGIKTLLTYKPSLMQIKLDGESAQGYFVVVGNARYYAGRFSITKRAQIDDGLLDICVFSGKTMASFVKFVQGVIAGYHLKFAAVSYYQAKEISVTSSQRTLVQADGEVISKTPIDFSVVPLALTVFVP